MTSISFTQDDEDSRPDTPLASTSSSVPPLLPNDAPSLPSVAQSSVSPLVLPSPPLGDSNTGSHLLPIPTPSTNKSQTSFSFPDIDIAAIEDLPPEITSADISLAPDGTYVETSSGAAARELKKRYDQIVGVNKDVRSPYATTAYVNQHGKQMFRVGLRDASAPAASAVEAEQRAFQGTSSIESRGESSHNYASRSKRRSRLSMHALLNTGTLKNGVAPPPPSSAKTDATTSSAVGPRKLRKTRSIPDMFGYSVSGQLTNTPQIQQKQTTITGRAHSHSVTGADMPRLPVPVIDVVDPPRGDVFGDVMHWGTASPYSAASGSASTGFSARSVAMPGDRSTDPYEEGQMLTIIQQPFGTGVAFDSPSRRPATDYLPTPHILREMQSFESGLTARASPDYRMTGKGKAAISDNDPDLHSNPPSPSIPAPDPPLSQRGEFVSPDTGLSPLRETSLHSRYSTDVFDVLQTYRGLPLLDRISPDSGETAVIKMSLRSDDTAAPRNDPRFVIWGEIQAEREDELSISQGSRTDLSSSAHSSHISRRKSSKASRTGSVIVPSVRLPSEEGESPKVLVAATIERWIAQLTSDLDYDELLMFLLTYRTYISAVDLLHLLICRFHWALRQPASSQDERVRRIVRVRTFVAIRYWLLTFFAEDFLPNRELRLLLADWLNALIRDPILEKHHDGLSIVRKLRKIAKECKEAHTRKEQGSSSPESFKPSKTTRSSATTQSRTRSTVGHVLGDKFAEAVGLDQDDSDLDLDFVPDEASPCPTTGFQTDAANTRLGPAHVGSGLSSPPKSTTSVSSPAFALLQQPLQQTILQQRSRSLVPGSTSVAAFTPNPDVLPIHHSALSRAFVKTLGRLGRWKRVLNSGSVVHTPLGACADVSAFDLELNESGDLLSVRGGVERYLKVLEQQPAPPSPLQGSTPKPSLDASRVPSPPPSALVDDSPPEYDEAVEVQPTPAQPDPPHPDIEAEQLDVVQPVPQKLATPVPTLRRSRSQGSFGSSSSGYGASIAAPRNERGPWQFDVVSIDDLDLSDTSSDRHAAGPALPPGLRRVPRRLPLRRDFEFIRRSAETVSSMGISRESYASGISTHSAISSSSMGPGLGGNIQQWQMNALVDSLSDEEEAGDVEDALRRLEGQINPAKQQEKASKVDGWVRAIQARQVAGDYGDEHPRFFSDDEDGVADGDSDDQNDETGSVQWSGYNDDAVFPASPADPDSGELSVPTESSSTPVGDHPATSYGSTPGSPLRRVHPIPADVVPQEILQSRVPSRPSTASGSPVAKKDVSLPLPSPASKFVVPTIPRVHRSFVLNYRSDTLVQHFSMIDRELFMGVKFEELVLDDWMSCEEVTVLDWAQYLKDRARWKAESRMPNKTSALAAVRARFNLIATFTLSEVVLTHPTERAMVVAKFIRIAWKAYCLSSFNTLVAIIAGLRSEWVTKAMRRCWNRVGIWEMRMFNDLTEWTSCSDDFKYIRQAVAAIADAKPINVGSHAPSVISTGGTDGSRNKSLSESKPPPPSACIPFIGVYLSQLHRHSQLPDLIDPTAPNEAVGIDPLTGNFDPPAHPEVFSSLAPLPPSMQLEPLINVHKQRLIASVIKALVAGQHLASRVQYPIDKKLFQRCLKLRGLDSETLQRVYANVP